MFLRNVFLLYVIGVQPGKRKLVRSHLVPRNRGHAEELIKSSMPFLDWSSPDILAERAAIYLRDGYPIVSVIQSHMEQLRDMKRVRNHIAHMSKESLNEYKKTLTRHFAVIPMKIPCPGEFLLTSCVGGQGGYYLLEYLRVIEEVAGQMT